MNETKKDIKTNESSKIKRTLLIIVCIFTSVVIIFGAVLGIVLGVKNSKAMVRIEGVRISEGEASFLITKYKRDFLIAYSAQDTDEFWNKAAEDGRTYAELFEERCELYIKDIAVKNYLFDTVDGIKLDNFDKMAIEKTIREVLEFRGSEGSEKKFNEIAEKYGFDYDDFSSAVTLLYKAEFIEERIFGQDGSAISAYSSDCQDYFDKNYSHVKLLLISYDTKFVLDENGNRVKENGDYKTAALTDEEKADRQRRIDEIEAKIDAYENKTGPIQMNSTHFDLLIEELGAIDPTRDNTEYYFSPYSKFSNVYFVKNSDETVNENNLEIAKNAIVMDKGYKRLDLEGGVCFIYKYENKEGAYANTSDVCFSDFYSLCAASVFDGMVKDFYGEVEIKDQFYGIDLIALPGDNPFVPKFEI